MKIPPPQTQENPRVPAADRPFNHSINVQMRFSDLDMLGHVNNNSYLTYADLGKVAYFERASPDGSLRTINAVVAHYDVDFYAPTYFSEKLCVLTAVTSISERAIRLEQRIVSRPQGMTKCIIRTVMVSVNPEDGRSAPADPRWVEALEKFEGRPLRQTDN